MNPSTEDVLEAIAKVPAKTVFVLPNNKNIIMAAEQAIKLADRNVCVLPSRTVPQGIASMLAFDPDADLGENQVNMSNALETVSTGSITFAARDSDYDGHEIHEGELLALDEPFTGLDEESRLRAAETIRRFRHGRTLILVTHRQEDLPLLEVTAQIDL